MSKLDGLLAGDRSFLCKRSSGQMETIDKVKWMAAGGAVAVALQWLWNRTPSSDHKHIVDEPAEGPLETKRWVYYSNPPRKK